MKGSVQRAFAALDRGGDLVRDNWGSVGLLWLATLPTRLLLLDLVIDAYRLGAAAQSHGDALIARSRWVIATWLISLAGRQVFVRACRMSMSGSPLLGWRRFGAPPHDLLAHAQSALAVEALFWALLPLTIAVPPLCVLAALCAVASPLAGPGWSKPFRALSVANGVLPIVLIGVGMVVALALLALNLAVFSWLLLWLAGGVSGLDLAPWLKLLNPLTSSLYTALILTGATLMVEPFWLATLVVLVQESRARASGEDLRDRFARLPDDDLPVDEPSASQGAAQGVNPGAAQAATSGATVGA